MRIRSLLALAALLVLAPAVAQAQGAAPPSHIVVGGGINLLAPSGDYGDAAGTGFGLGVHGGYALPVGPLWIVPGVGFQFDKPGEKNNVTVTAINVFGEGRAIYMMNKLAPYGVLGFGLSNLKVEVGGGSDSKTKFGSFKLGGGCGYLLTSSLTIDGHLEFQSLKGENDSFTQLVVGADASFHF